MKKRKKAPKTVRNDSEELLHLGRRVAEKLSETAVFKAKKKKPDSTSRETAQGLASTVINILQELGCQIELPSHEVLSTTSDDSALEQTRDEIEDSGAGLADLITIWQTRDIGLWNSTAPDLFQILGRRLIKLGEPLVAYDVLMEGLSVTPLDAVLRQLLALSLARSGAQKQAEEILAQLVREGHHDEEVLGTKARIHKDLWSLSADAGERDRQLRLAFENYAEAYRMTGGYWTGINAATMAILMNLEEEAIPIAQRVHEQCLEALEATKRESDRYWPVATLGEACLILKKWAEAEKWYSEAAELGKGKVGDLSSTRRNARLLINHLQIDGSAIERCFQIPKVVVFSGHMIDQPDRPNPRFPSQLERVVFEEIENRLAGMDAQIGYASGACGSDILFLEAMGRRQGETHIVLPFQSDDFIKASVDLIPGADWLERYQKVCKHSAEVITASASEIEGGGIAFQYANLLLRGLACIRAEQLETDVALMVVWDGKGGDGPGGTASMIESWKACGRSVEIINLDRILHDHCPELKTEQDKVSQTAYSDATPVEEIETMVRSLLFADLVHFSELTEDEIPKFVNHFLGGVAQLIETSEHAPNVKNTWGDGLYFAFDEVRSAGLFALELRDFVLGTNWRKAGLSRNLNVRIGLHVGPVYGFVDPITRKRTYFGGHVAKTARIEPVTPPGKVYASQAFAALSAADRTSGFKCEYVGQTPLAKGFGTFPTYHVRRI